MEAPEIPEFPQFVHETVTRWSDDDSQGVLNNAVYMTLFEEARHGFSRTAEVLVDGAFPFLLAQTNVRFVSPGRGGERARGTLHRPRGHALLPAGPIASARPRRDLGRGRARWCATTPTPWSRRRSRPTSATPSRP